MTVDVLLERFLIELDEARDSDARYCLPETVAWIEQADELELAELLRALQRAVCEPSPSQEALLAAAMRCLIGNASFRQRGTELVDELADTIAALYRQLGEGSAARAHLLQILAMRGNSALRIWSELIVQAPPLESTAVLVAFAPLFQRRDYDPGCLFPQLSDAMAHPGLAAAVVDLANYQKRAGLVEVHPLSDRKARLAVLLGDLTQRLGLLEEQVGQQRAGGDAAKLAQAVEESIALAVSLCDALALIGDRSEIGKLYQALELKHRRLHTEAAAALARLGEQPGEQALLRMAAEPVTRLRVLAYANELGCLEKVAPEFQTPGACAEAELALWLSQPTQFGIPPSKMEVVGHRQQYWPGFEEEVECFLIRFTYRFAADQYSNIGIAGPTTHTFADDLADLAPDDIYAAFAGWHAQHEELYEMDVTDLTEAHQADVARLQRRLSDAGYDSIGRLKLGFFFGEKVLLARASREGVAGIAVVDHDSVQWHSETGKARPVSPAVAYFIYKGRRLLRSFN